MTPIPGSPGDVPQRVGTTVRWVPGAQARKRYVCPGCGNGVAVGESHVVAWPEGQPDHRDHWHTHCWRQEARGGRLA